MTAPTRDSVIQNAVRKTFPCNFLHDPVHDFLADEIVRLRATLAAVEAERDAWAKGFERRGLTPLGRDATPEEAQYIVADTFGRIETLTQQLAAAQRCVSFFASVIKSGEAWSETCEEELRAALAPQREGA